LINHSPRLRTDAPNQDDMNTPTKKMNVREVINPRPNKEQKKASQMISKNMNCFIILI
jgi:hypothetical protein